MIYSRISLVLLLMALLLGGLAAQETHECALTCQVVDAKTHEPLPNATIWIETLNKGLVTNAQGYAKLEGICSCKCHIKVQYVGYNSISKLLNFSSDTSMTLYMLEDDKVLEQVSVEANIEERDLKTLSVSRLNAEQLSKAKVQGLGQALENITGVQSLRTGNHVAKPIIHGLHSNRILILNNGIRQEGQQWGAEHAPEIDAFAAEQLSVIKGAATVRYGAEALGGVVLVEPADLPTQGGLGGSLQLDGHSNGRVGAASGFLEGGIKGVDGLGFRVQASKKRGGDGRTPDYWLTNTGIAETGVSLALGIDREQWGVEGYYSFYENTTGILAATSVLGSLTDLSLALSQETPARTSEDFSYEIGWPRQEVSHHLAKAEGFLKLGNGQSMNWKYGYQRNHREEFDRRLGEERSKRPVIDLLIQTHSLDVDYRGWNWERWEGTAGVNVTHKNNDNLPGTGRIPFIPNHNSWEAGAFLLQKAEWERWSLEAGLRYDFKHFSIIGRDYKNDIYRAKRNLYNFTATAGATFKPNPRHTISTNIGTAWRAPNVAELYAFGKKQGVGAIEYGLLIGEQNRILSWEEQDIPNEQGIKWVGNYQFEQNGWVMEATAYTNWVQNYLYLRPYGVTANVSGPYPYYRYRQTDALFTGLDFDIVKRLGQHWKWSGSTSLIWAEDLRNQDELPFIPANRLRSAIEYSWPKSGKWASRKLEVNAQYVARATQVPEQILSIPELVRGLEEGRDLVGENPRNFDFMEAPDGYFLLNLSGSTAIEVGQEALLKVEAGIDNLLNTRYRRYTNRLRYFADEPGRNVRVSIKYVF